MGVVAKTVVGSGVVAVVGVVAGTVIGWPVVWDWLTGWWTPGWGNLFTVAIASAALGVSAWFNRQTLTRTAERHEQTRRDAAADKLRAEIIGLINGLSELSSRTATVVRRVHELRDGIDTNAPDAAKRTENAAQSIIQEELGPLYRQISAHHFAITLMNNDPTLKEIVEDLSMFVARDRLVWERSTDDNPVHETDQQRAQRQQKLEADVKRLMTFAHKEIGPSPTDDPHPSPLKWTRGETRWTVD